MLVIQSMNDATFAHQANFAHCDQATASDKGHFVRYANTFSG